MIVLLTVCIEMAFNVHAIQSGYDIIDLTEEVKLVEEEGNEKYVVDYKVSDGIYINKVNIKAKFPSNNAYAIQTTEINGFGRETEAYYEDVVNSWYDNFFTSLKKKVSFLRITIPKPEDAELYSVSISNRFEFNKYRVLLSLFVLTLLYLIFFEKEIIKKIEWYFVIFSLLFGILLIVCGQPVCNSWDEAFHFEKAYSLANGKNVNWSEAAYITAYDSVPGCNTREEYAELRNSMDQKGKNIFFTDKRETTEITYSSLAYLPMALFLKIGLFLDLPFSQLYMLGKLGNLLFYILIMYWAIRLAQQKKIFLVLIALMPTSIFLASSYTYDSCVFACVTLGCVLWCNESFSGANDFKTFNVILAIFLLSVGCLSKAVYIPLVMIMLLLPQFMKMKKKRWWIYCLGILIVLGLVMLTFVLPVISNTVSGNLSYGGDARGGDTGTIRQLISMVKHPLASIKLMITSIFQFDNFRNLGTYWTDNYFFGNLMFLNFAQMGVLPDKWAALLVPLFVITILYEDKENKKVIEYSLWKRLFLLAIIIITIFLIWLALYLDFTPVGEEAIYGVQARYYLPLLYVSSLLFANNKYQIRSSYNTVCQQMLACVNIFWLVAVFELVLKYRLI